MKRIFTALMLVTLSGLAACYQNQNGAPAELGDMNDAEKSAASAASITVYYKADAQWIATQGSSVNIHYNADDAGWTAVPGVAMTKHTGAYDKWVGYASFTVSASKLTFCFNRDGAVWDNNGGRDYTISAPGVYTVADGVVSPYTSAYGDIYYRYTGEIYPDYIIGGFMVKLCRNGSSSVYASKPFCYSTTHGTSVRFSDLPAGSYKAVVNENYGGMNYYGETEFTVAAGAEYFSSVGMDIIVSDPNAVTVYYKPDAQWLDGTVNCHYDNGTGWTAVPGLAMTKITDEYSRWNGYAKIAVSGAAYLRFCFNKNGSVWDNNNCRDYEVRSSGLYTVVNGVVTKKN